jgi:acyl-CoA synthetase (AMP-forming)/AMP-acid ligase II
MDGYVGEEAAATDVFQEGWYTGFRDIAFRLEGRDGKPDYYWMARDSALLIRGGANYACEQVATTLSRFIEEEFQVKPDQFRIAVVGLPVDSEHEDSCCVTIELAEEAASLAPALSENFLDRATRKVPKGCRPDYVRFADIPVNFKGAVLVPRLKEEFARDLKERTRPQKKPER